MKEVKNLVISGPKLEKGVKLSVTIETLGQKWYRAYQVDLNFDHTYMYYNQKDFYKLLRQQLYEKLVRLKESL